MKRSLLALLLSCSAATASAGIINGGFEADLAGWNTFNFAGIATTATEGIKSARMDAVDSDPDNAAALEIFVGATDAALQAIKSGFTNFTEGSAIQQTFFANAGDVVSFDWRFLTDEEITSGFDFSFYVLDGAAFALGDTNIDSGYGAGVEGYNTATAWNTAFVTIATTGTHSLSFGTLQADDNDISSGLLIDNVKGAGNPIPEPATLALLGLGLAGLGFSRRKGVGRVSAA